MKLIIKQISLSLAFATFASSVVALDFSLQDGSSNNSDPVTLQECLNALENGKILPPPPPSKSLPPLSTDPFMVFYGGKFFTFIMSRKILGSHQCYRYEPVEH
jgi:hypothetical protein